jgi:hypothetical protein
MDEPLSRWPIPQAAIRTENEMLPFYVVDRWRLTVTHEFTATSAGCSALWGTRIIVAQAWQGKITRKAS